MTLEDPSIGIAKWKRKVFTSYNYYIPQCPICTPAPTEAVLEDYSHGDFYIIHECVEEGS